MDTPIRDAEAFKHTVLDAPGAVIVTFLSPDCGPCVALDESLRRLADRPIAAASVDVDRSPELAARYGVRGVPTLVAFRHGQMAAMKVGTAPAPEIAAWIERVTAA